MRKRSLDFARDDPMGFGVMVCNIGDILLGHPLLVILSERAVRL